MAGDNYLERRIDSSELLPDALTALQQERPVLGGAEEWRGRSTAGRLWPPERSRSYKGPGAAVRVVAAVYQLLPTLIQAEIQDARRRSRAQGLLRAGDA